MTTTSKSILKSTYLFLIDNFHLSQHLEYRLLKRGYLLYQHEVLKQNKTFELYVRDYLAEIQNFNYNNPNDLAEKSRIHTRVSDIITLRQDLILQYFNLKTFDFKSYKQLTREYNVSEFIPVQSFVPTSATIDLPVMPVIIEEQLAKVRAEILKYESGEKQPKHIGHRMFGYLLKANYFNAYNDEQRLDAWQKFTGLDSKPEMSYLRDPDYNKNETDKINKQLKSIEEFFYLVGLKVFIDYQKKNIKK